MPGSMSGEEKRSDGLSASEQRKTPRALAPPVLYATALLLDSTRQAASQAQTMSPAARKAVSARMKKYWAARRAK